jgi:hypothetical protein
LKEGEDYRRLKRKRLSKKLLVAACTPRAIAPAAGIRDIIERE